MVHDWFKVAIRFQEIVESDKVKTVVEEYLYQAISYADAEYKATEDFQSRNNGFEIHKVTKTSYNEVLFCDTNLTPVWYDSKVQFVIYDEKTKQEKRTNIRLLVAADNIITAHTAIRDTLGTMDDYEITEIKKTKILEVYLATETEAEVPKGNFVPVDSLDNANQIEEPEAS